MYESIQYIYVNSYTLHFALLFLWPKPPVDKGGYYYIPCKGMRNLDLNVEKLAPPPKYKHLHANWQLMQVNILGVTICHHVSQ